ncbi:MAG TPA: LysE family translocator [Duganella sp.]|nr:LysE family translocator [Duganella sp.]
MLDIQNYGSFVAAILVFQAIPGAGTIAILDSTARNGRGAGMAAVMGTLAGDAMLMTAAVAGLAALLQANPMFFQGLQWFGAAYLFWMGGKLLFASADDNASVSADRLTSRGYFQRALVVSLTNPKVILFFIAFFPLFLKPHASPLTLPVMMLHVTMLSLVYQAALVFIGNLVAVRLQEISSARVIASRLAGVTLIALSMKLASRIR